MTEKEWVNTLLEQYKQVTFGKQQTGDILGVSAMTIDRMRQHGLLRSKKVMGKVIFDVHEIARFLAEA